MKELKEKLIDKINQLQDEALLLALDQIIDRIPLPEVKQLNQYEKERIQLGLDDLAAGRLVDDEEVRATESAWLKK